MLEMIKRFLIASLLAGPHLAAAQEAPTLYFGADLSYVNEMEDCGAEYRENALLRDPFELFAERGANLVRVRLWHNPTWTAYSTLDDVRKTIQRTKTAGMQTLLDFHYSDDWADPSKQFVPAAWQGLTFDTLKDSLYRYTHEVLTRLHGEDLLPEMVQLGNEINPGLLLPHGSTSNWAQLGALLNEAIRAVRDVESASGWPIKVMLHVAQPEHVHEWISSAINDGEISDFDAVGLSYYKNWSHVPLNQLADYVSRLATAFGREVIVVETAYPWTLAGKDGANNILGSNALEIGYPATPEAQDLYMVDLTQAIFNGGGNGIVYWEPAWVSTPCSTRWGQGSHWENATFFDFNNTNEVLPAIDYMTATYAPPRTVPVTLRVNMAGRDTSRGVFVAGDMTYDTSGDWQMLSMIDEGDAWYASTVDLHPQTAYRFSFYNGSSFAQNQEPLSVACAGDSGDNRLISIPENGGSYDYNFGTCDDLVDVTVQVDMTGVNTSAGVYIAGDLTKNAAAQWTFRQLQPAGGDLFTTSFRLVRGGRYPFAFYTGTAWSNDEKESVPHQCATAWGTHRTLEVPDDRRAMRFRYGSCVVTDATSVEPREGGEGMGILLPHYPNPVGGQMTFAYDLPRPSYVRLSVFDLLGREVAIVDEGQRLAAKHEVDYDARLLPRGVYVYRLVTDDSAQTRSMIVL